jgi:paraquat-inducible protein B
VIIILWVLSLILLGAVLYLNYTATQIIQSSQIHAESKKRNLIALVWLLPVVGTFAALYLINRDIRKNQAKIEQDIAPAIRELANRIRNLEADIHNEEKKQKYH